MSQEDGGLVGKEDRRQTAVISCSDLAQCVLLGVTQPVKDRAGSPTRESVFKAHVFYCDTMPTHKHLLFGNSRLS